MGPGQQRPGAAGAVEAVPGRRDRTWRLHVDLSAAGSWGVGGRWEAFMPVCSLPDLLSALRGDEYKVASLG